ncbi:RNA polymerase II subunit A C-terminal domain phosphatase-like [Takifugu rubripes]|uniref:RNA polymerase II subunit A C-terminal domain phosphatase-like n=1 Tax=Takifugu rubripes TaxID=31033 RepID=UPI0011456F70|nr:RNA polymerase II subunit A C-terminal domain phosphatase-like [Takifugu rubripes]
MENPEPPGAQSPDTCLQGSNCQDSPPNTEESLGAPMGNETPEEDITLETFQRLSERLTKVHQNKLHQSKKLVLMVDLDNTLIHATEEPCECSPNENLFKMTMENSNPYHIRIRPYYKEFLEKMSQLYELNIFTFASRPYAKIIAGNSPNLKTLTFGMRIIVILFCW